MENSKKRALLQFFQAVGQAERLKMLGMMANRPHSIQEMAELLGLKETAVLHHIERLQELELIEEESRQFSYTYRLNNDALKQFEQIIIAGKAVPDFTEQVLDQYIKGRKLKRLPTNAKERVVILKWMANHFEINKKYSESRVNDIILHHYGRQEMMRRYLLDGRYLKRTGGIYWRPETKE